MRVLECFRTGFRPQEELIPAFVVSGEASFRPDPKLTPYSPVPAQQTPAEDKKPIFTLLVSGQAVLDAKEQRLQAAEAEAEASATPVDLPAREPEPTPVTSSDGESGPQQQRQHGSAPNEAAGSSSSSTAKAVSKASRSNSVSRCEFVNRGGGSSIVQTPSKTTPWHFPDPFVKKIHESVVTQRFGIPHSGVQVKPVGNPRQLELLANPELMRQKVRFEVSMSSSPVTDESGFCCSTRFKIVDYLVRLKHRNTKQYDEEKYMLTRLEDSILMICEMHRLFPDMPNKHTTSVNFAKSSNKVRL
jgi:hypothetical protein